jgi:hypothetical protein
LEVRLPQAKEGRQVRLQVGNLPLAEDQKAEDQKAGNQKGQDLPAKDVLVRPAGDLDCGDFSVGFYHSGETFSLLCVPHHSASHFCLYQKDQQFRFSVVSLEVHQNRGRLVQRPAGDLLDPFLDPFLDFVLAFPRSIDRFLPLDREAFAVQCPELKQNSSDFRTKRRPPIGNTLVY